MALKERDKAGKGCESEWEQRGMGWGEKREEWREKKRGRAH